MNTLMDADAGLEFTEIYRSCKDELYGYCRYLAHDETEAEDLFQETCVKLLRTQTRVESAKGYALRTARNLFLNRHRSEQRGRAALRGLVERTPASAPGADETSERGETHDRLWRAVDALPREQAEVVFLRYLSDLSYAEIAEVLHENVSTVTNRCHYGLQKIALALSEK